MRPGDYTLGIRALERTDLDLSRFSKWDVMAVGHHNACCHEVTIGSVGDRYALSLTQQDRPAGFIALWEIRGCEVRRLGRKPGKSLSVQTTRKPIKSVRRTFETGRADVVMKHKCPKSKLGAKLAYGKAWAEQFEEPIY